MSVYRGMIDTPEGAVLRAPDEILLDHGAFKVQYTVVTSHRGGGRVGVRVVIGSLLMRDSDGEWAPAVLLGQQYDATLARAITAISALYHRSAQPSFTY